MLMKILNGASIISLVVATAVTTFNTADNPSVDIDLPTVRTSQMSYREVSIPCLEEVVIEDPVEETEVRVSLDPVLGEPIIEEAYQTSKKIKTPLLKEDLDYTINTEDIEMIAKTLYGECRGIECDMEKAAVVWCILNRVDTKGYACGNSIEYVITFPYQFLGYDEDNPVWDDLYDLAEDVLNRWCREKEGETDVGRILPPEYLWFHGDGKHNYFRDAYKGGNRWDWSLENPYEN